MNKFHQYTKSPIGLIEIIATNKAIISINYVIKRDNPINQNFLTKKCDKQLNEFFTKKRQKFDLKIELRGTTFQKKVWQALQAIPYGQTCSYLDIAIKINHPQAVRAVGNANKLNALSIIVPCHRVIGKNKKLIGYAGGLEKKSWLIQHEEATLYKGI